MKKTFLLLLAFTFSIMTMASVEKGTINKIEQRMEMLKGKLQNELRAKNYGNKVDGSYEISGDYAKLNVSMVQVKGREQQSPYSINETLDIVDFSVMASSEYFPTESYVGTPLINPLSATGAVMLASLLGLLMARRKAVKAKKKKRAKRREEEKTSDRRAA